MKNKKWTTVTITSLVVIIVEVILLFVLILPGKKVNDVFKELENGNGRKADRILDEMSDSGEKKVNDYMNDFATYQCNQYLDGNITYEKLDKTLSAIDELDDYYAFSQPYYSHVASTEMLRLYEQGYAEYQANWESALYDDLKDQSKEVYYNLYYSDKTDDDLKAYLQEKYDSFLNGSLSYDDIKDYVRVAEDFFGGDALSYAYDIDSDLYMIESYQEDYDTAKEYYDNQQYFETIEECDSVYISDNDTTGFYEKFQTLRQDAYDAGKTYYVQQAEDCANAGDYTTAKEIIAQIKEVYGTEVDTSAVEALMKDPWMDAYAAYVSNATENLKADAATGVKIGNCDDTSTINVDEYIPEEIYLYDFDGNGTPEMLLTVDTYAWIVGFDGQNAVLTGFVHAATFCDAPYFITIPMLMPEGYSGYALLELSNNVWNVVTYYYAANDGSRFEVDGAEVSYDECSAKHDEIAQYENKDIKVNYGDVIENYEAVIYNYPSE
ncbi:MAG: hypothetical protein NC240_08650 [Clostridium sp.]|nr:hypothetical protein [Clostridium sp.]